MVLAPTTRLTAALLCGGTLIATLGGCAAAPHDKAVRVDARQESGVGAHTSYRLRNATANEADSLRFQEVASFVRTALSGRGLHEAPDDASAELIIEIEFGAIAPGTREEVVRLPTYRTVPGRSQESVFVVGTNNRGEDQVIRHRHRDPDQRVLVGHREVTVSNTHHERFLKLTARENQPQPPADTSAEVWSVEVRTKGNDEDLREDLPLLAATALSYVAHDTRGRMIVQIADDDPAIDFVKNRP